MTTEQIYLYGIPLQELPKYQAKKPIGTTPVEVHDGINYELLDEIMSFISHHPETWRQTSWYAHVDRKSGVYKPYAIVEEVTDANVCGTSFCFAGHVAIHEGFAPPPDQNIGGWYRDVVYSDGDHRTEEASEFARKVLGLTWAQADALFEADNTLEDLEKIVKILHLMPNVDGDALQYVDGYTVDEFVENYDKILEEYV